MNLKRTVCLVLALTLALSVPAALALTIGPPTNVPINRQISRNTAKTLEFQPEVARARTDTLVIGVSDLIGERNPFWVDSFGDHYVAALQYDELLFANNTGEIGSGVASFTRSKDGNTFTFTLNDAVRYTDGAAVSSDDFINALYLLLTPGFDGVYDVSPAGIVGVDAYLAGDAAEISGIQRTDARTFSVTLAAGNVNSLLFFAIPALRVSAFGDMRRPGDLPPADFDAFYSEGLARVRQADLTDTGYGQCTFSATEAGAKTTLVKHEGYWRGAPYIGTVEILVIPADGEVGAILDGTVDIISALGSVDNVDAVVDFERGFVNLYTWEGDVIGYLLMDLADPRFSDKAVRQALACGFDREAARQNRIERYGTVPDILLFDSFSPTIAHMFEEQFPYDQARAAQLLDEAGWLLDKSDGLRHKDDQTLSFTVLFSSPNPVMDVVFRQMQDNYSALGIAVTAEQVPYETLLERTAQGAYEMAFQARRLPASASLASSLFGGGSHLNETGYDDEMLQRLRTLATLEADPERQNVLYELYFQQLYLELPFIPLYRRSELLLANARVMNISITTAHDITADLYRFFLVDTLEGQW